ncbi:TetR family transcriptional regulator [Hypericibacter terrae]|uniref:TetR family transcriptional regulator n=1 Tax=Hypericibacter terrae TaxID=2602015 RepID=A0A5J6MEB4_9PROT|nr:TetR family transcriptional regulator [Hypericibacter terrae]QEX15788.1 TetR family transcriptional regulator [Hypericibacter terrae]
MAEPEPSPDRPTKLGRRPGDNATGDKILDAAEEEFAARGYEGTSLREISQRAKINQALIRYYFGSKQGLYCSIYLRRGQELGRERIRLLDALEARPGQPPTIEELVRAFIVPAIEIKRQGAGGVAYMRLHARLQDEAPDFMSDLRKRVYDESTTRYINALKRALGDMHPDCVYWRMIFLIGAYFYTLADSDRLEAYSGGSCSTKDLDECVRQIVPFLVGGLTAPMPRK